MKDLTFSHAVNENTNHTYVDGVDDMAVGPIGFGLGVDLGAEYARYHWIISRFRHLPNWRTKRNRCKRTVADMLPGRRCSFSCPAVFLWIYCRWKPVRLNVIIIQQIQVKESNSIANIV